MMLMNNTSKEMMIKKILWMTNNRIKLLQVIPNYKFKILLKALRKASFKKIKNKMMIPWPNIIKGKMQSWNGQLIILVRNGKIPNLLAEIDNFIKINLIFLIGHLLLKIYNGKDLNKLLKIRSL